MAFETFASFDLAGPGDAESFHRASVALDFRHPRLLL
jgi:hypothetical protein